MKLIQSLQRYLNFVILACVCDWELYKSVYILKFNKIGSILFIIPPPIFSPSICVCDQKCTKSVHFWRFQVHIDIFHASPLEKKTLPILLPILNYFGKISLALLGSSVRRP